MGILAMEYLSWPRDLVVDAARFVANGFGIVDEETLQFAICCISRIIKIWLCRESETTRFGS